MSEPKIISGAVAKKALLQKMVFKKLSHKGLFIRQYQYLNNSEAMVSCISASYSAVL